MSSNQKAIEALRYAANMPDTDDMPEWAKELRHHAREALRSLEDVKEEEPVAWMSTMNGFAISDKEKRWPNAGTAYSDSFTIPLYRHPSPSKPAPDGLMKDGSGDASQSRGPRFPLQSSAEDSGRISASIAIAAPRFFLDVRSGCAAVRDRLHPDYCADYNGLHWNTSDVIAYEHGTPFNTDQGNRWSLLDKQVEKLQLVCDHLNAIIKATQP